MRYRQLLRTTTPHRNRLLLVVVLLLAVTATNLANPLIAAKVTDFILAGPGNTAWSLEAILGAWFVLLVARAGFGFAGNLLVGTTGAEMSAALRSRVYEHMQILPLAWFQGRKQGETLSLLSNDAEAISRFVTNTVVRLLPQLLTLAFAFLAMAWIDPEIALVAALLLPGYTVITKLVGRRIRPLTTDWIRSWSSLVGFVNENLGLMPVLKAFGREARESNRFSTHNRDLLNVARRQIRLSSLLTPLIGLMAGGGALLLLWIGIGHLQQGRLQASDLVALMLYVMLLTGPLSALAGVYGQAMYARGAAERLLELFDERPEPLGQGTRNLEIEKGRIEFRDIEFRYPGREPLFVNLNLLIREGETIALTGPNGCGKSTLVHLLMRFMDPQAGQVLVDGQDIRSVALESLRSQIGLVAQNTLLLNNTVAENIRYGLPDANEDDIKKAAKAAQAEAFIEKLPNGYETVIGDQGVRLSGGQRQRLSLARTLLRDPPILVLDEATSMFDPDGEFAFLQELEHILRNRTTILITHRPASLELADRIVRLPFDASEGGRTADATRPRRSQG